jgi:phosphatidate cytidylyltransferase
MATRILTGLILAPLVIAAAWFAPDSMGLAIIVAGAFLATHEYLSMSSLRELKWVLVAAAVWTAIGPLAVRFGNAHCLVGYLCVTPMLAMGLFLVLTDRIPKAYNEVAALGFSVSYVSVLMMAVAGLACLDGNGGPALLTLFAVVWLGDTGAYFGGKSLGRHKLHPKVSPKKTMEGSLFGLLGSVGGAFLIDAVFGTPLSWHALLLAGLLGGAAEQIGDLCESVLKRSAGVKDSGKILPGHGGILDRIDGLLFAAPIVLYFYMQV